MLIFLFIGVFTSFIVNITDDVFGPRFPILLFSFCTLSFSFLCFPFSTFVLLKLFKVFKLSDIFDSISSCNVFGVGRDSWSFLLSSTSYGVCQDGKALTTLLSGPLLSTGHGHEVDRDKRTQDYMLEGAGLCCGIRCPRAHTPDTGRKKAHAQV